LEKKREVKIETLEVFGEKKWLGFLKKDQMRKERLLLKGTWFLRRRKEEGTLTKLKSENPQTQRSLADKRDKHLYLKSQRERTLITDLMYPTLLYRTRY
jgi:hypothetical protein